jgi:hypothetical protein
MRGARAVPRLVTAVVVVALAGVAAVACTATIDGRGTVAAGVLTPGATGSGSPSGSPTDSPSGSPSGSRTDTPTPSPTRTVDPVKTKERVTCVLVQATIKSTNDAFNAAKTRDAQIKVLKSASTTIDKTLKASGLARTDKIFGLAAAILGQLRTIVASAEHGGNPSTGPYNTLTTRFRTACLDL